MINHIVILLPVKTDADFTSWICVAAALCPHCQNAHYFADLQQLPQYYVSLTSTKKLSNQHTTVPHAVLIRRKNRAIRY